MKGAGRRAGRVLAAALSAIALSDDAAGSATTGPLTANGETETHAHGFVALALSYAVPLLARVLPEAYIFVMYFFPSPAGRGSTTCKISVLLLLAGAPK